MTEDQISSPRFGGDKSPRRRQIMGRLGHSTKSSYPYPPQSRKRSLWVCSFIFLFSFWNIIKVRLTSTFYCCLFSSVWIRYINIQISTGQQILARVLPPKKKKEEILACISISTYCRGTPFFVPTGTMISTFFTFSDGCLDRQTYRRYRRIFTLWIEFKHISKIHCILLHNWT